jgi:hypothetical protein
MTSFRTVGTRLAPIAGTSRIPRNRFMQPERQFFRLVEIGWAE